jgi:hypothetical protein
MAAGLVDGPCDPRLPTLAGLMRAGCHPDALREFLLEQVGCVFSPTVEVWLACLETRANTVNICCTAAAVLRQGAGGPAGTSCYLRLQQADAARVVQMHMPAMRAGFHRDALRTFLLQQVRLVQYVCQSLLALTLQCRCTACIPAGAGGACS